MRKTQGWKHVISLCALALASSFAGAGPIEDLAAGFWLELPNTRMDAVDPCPQNNCSYTGGLGQSAVVDAWNGGAFDTNGNRLIIWGGGHMGYAGNEVYLFDVATLHWSRASEPSTNVSCNFSTGELPDNRPCSAHTYDYLDFHPGTNSLAVLGSASNYPQGGGGAPRVHMFDLGSKTWRRGADRQENVSLTGASVAYDASRDAFWMMAAFGQRLAKYEPTANGGAGKWTLYSPTGVDIDTASAVDPVHDLLVTLDGRSSGAVIVHDLKNPDTSRTQITTAGDKAAQNDSAQGFVWDSSSKKFVAWIGGSQVYTLTPPSGDWRTQAWQWTRVNPAAGNLVTPTSPNEDGTYSRFQYMPALNAFILYNRTNNNVFVYKLTSGPGVVDPTITLNANPTSVNVQGSSTLTWSTTQADACTASASPAVAGWSGSKATTGTETVGPIAATTSFTLSCTSTGGGSASRSVTVSTATTPAPTVNFSANPTSVAMGGSSTLTWSTSNATTCTASGAWSGAKATSGTQGVGPLSAAATYNLSCTGTGGTTQKSATVSIVSAPTANLSANPTTVNSGGSSTLTWSSTNATGCTASGDWAGNKAASGTQSTGALTSSKSYSITCTGAGGTSPARTATVTVGAAAAPTLTFGANPTTVNSGGSSTLTWSSTNAASCTASGAWSGSKATSGNQSTGALTASKTYNLSCTGAGGTVQKSASVTVNAASPPPPAAPTVDLSANPLSVSANGTSMLSWTSTNATSCTASGAWSGTKGTSGSEATAALSNDSSFTLACTGAGGSSSDAVTVTVVAGGGGGGGGGGGSDAAAGGGAFDWVAILFLAMIAGARAFFGRPTVIVRRMLAVLSILALPLAAQAQSTDPDVDWQQRSTGPDILTATRFDNQADVTTWSSQLEAADHVHWVTSGCASPSGGCMKFDVRKTDGSQSGNWAHWLADDHREFGEGDEFYVQFRQYLPAYYATHRFLNGDGFKQAIISRHAFWMGPAPSGSNQPNEVVLQSETDFGFVYGYNQNNHFTARGWAVGAQTACSNSDFRYQNAIDNDPTQPESAGTCAQAQARFGGLYSYYGQSNAPNGRPNPNGGEFKFYPDEWLTFLVNIRVGNWNQENTRIRLWAARQGQPYKLLVDRNDIELGFNPSDSGGAKYDSLWLLPYNTNRSPDSSRQDTYTMYDELIVSKSFIAAPGGTAPNNPTVTLSANPTTVNAQGSSTLTWSTTNANACTASASPAVSGWSGTKATSGNLTVGPIAATTNFTLSCTSTGGGSATKSVTVSTSTTPAPTVNLSANPTTVSSGGSSTLTWSSSNATSCTASGAWTGSKATSGSQSVGPITAAATYTLACTGAGGTTSKSATVSLVSAPTVNFTANPTTVNSGGSSTLTWSSTNATGCTASGDWAGNKATSGNQSTGALTATKTYTLACTGAGGTTSKNVTVTVGSAAAPTVNFSANPTTVNSGGSSTLAWSSTNATGCTASGGWTGSKATSGSQSTGALTTTKTYNLSCTGGGGTTQRSVTVTVSGSTPPPPAAPTVDLTASPMSISTGATSMLTWSSTDATSCTASDGWSGARGMSGSEATAALTNSSTFTLTCTGAGGTASDSVTVSVVAGGGGGGGGGTDPASGGGALDLFSLLSMLLLSSGAALRRSRAG